MNAAFSGGTVIRGCLWRMVGGGFIGWRLLLVKKFFLLFAGFIVVRAEIKNALVVCFCDRNNILDICRGPLWGKVVYVLFQVRKVS